MWKLVLTVALLAFGMVVGAEETWSVEFTVNLSPGKQGTFVVEVHPEWTPNGANRFKEMVEDSFFNGNRFFRVIEGQFAQFGIHGNPVKGDAWAKKPIQDDATEKAPHNYRGTIAFSSKVAKSGPKYGPLTGSNELNSERLHFLAAAKMEGEHSRSTQMFINLKDNLKLLDAGAVPFGRVTSGMDVVDQLYSGYGETASAMKKGSGTGPDQVAIQTKGNKYLKTDFGLLSYIVSARELSSKEEL